MANSRVSNPCSAKSTRRSNILVICPYPEDEVPGQRLKYEQYFPHLRASGFRITVSPFFGLFAYRRLYRPGYFLVKILATLYGYAKRTVQIVTLPFYDGVYVSLNVTPLGGPFFERLYRIAIRRMIFDIDDLIFLPRTTSQNRIVSLLRGPKKHFYLMRVANHVITCTPYLDTIVRKYNCRTSDISSTVNTDLYVSTNLYQNDHRLVIGWSGSHSTVPYLRLLIPVLQRLRRRYDFSLFIIGTADFAVEGIESESRAWNRATEVKDLQRIDIGVYPLPEEEWVYGKSGLKAIQYMALGIPTVATAIGTNFRVIEDGVSGFLVRSEQEWEARLGELICDPALRARLGRNARNRVEKLYSVRVNEPVYREIFETVFNN